MAQQTVNEHSQMLVRLIPICSLWASVLSVITGASRMIAALLNTQVYSYSLLEIVRLLTSSAVFTDHAVNLVIPLTFICRASVPELHADVSEAFDRGREILSIIDSAALALDRLLWELGYCLSAIVNSEGPPIDPVDIQSIILALHWLCEKLPGHVDLSGLSWDK